MRPVGVYAKGHGQEIEQLEADLRGRWRQVARKVMVLLSARSLVPVQIALKPSAQPNRDCRGCRCGRLGFW
jgi:hypothetical protein